MPVSGIKSRPVYPGLSPDPNARSNLIVCDQGGAEAAAELLARADAEFGQRTNIILAAEGMSTGERDAAVKRLAPTSVEVVDDLTTAIGRLNARLAAATMGLRLYAAGTEPLIGSVVQAGAKHFIDPLSVRTEHRGSLKRRVQCVHCKGMIENVTTNPVPCPHCGLLLLVRDHYSRRLAAFQGVCINAEDPQDKPEPQVEFQ
ncbi:dimethylamine monooxygenase subunit DmmA family protein [Hyphomicrobium sp. CS1GBMeth3]|uniref:dimethylamine monooxygenase subunit DmmA family protein n=1 Tax=Hyphomicrobium sp. CS1GBMeth3 TaxID=1892845 RepID=UPI0009311A56|nr:dimethylamine monooxygenase subunit DmmA family protein [Hyphomicrobium sp. CS1GBMeth3]